VTKKTYGAEKLVPFLELMSCSGGGRSRPEARVCSRVGNRDDAGCSRGSAYLYTEEYYRLAADRLAPGGVMCQWLTQYDAELPAFAGEVLASPREVYQREAAAPGSDQTSPHQTEAGAEQDCGEQCPGRAGRLAVA